jgi:hypothetical protein
LKYSKVHSVNRFFYSSEKKSPMSCFPRQFCLVTICLALTLTGCNKALNHQKTIAIGPGEIKSFTVDAPRQNQKVTVTFKSSVTPVNVYIVLEKDFEVATKLIQSDSKHGPFLNKLENSKEGSVSADIPAKAEFGVMVAGAVKDTSVEVKLTSK